MSPTLTIEKEAVEKLIEVILKKDNHFDYTQARSLLLDVDMSSSKKIHDFVLGITKLMKTIEPFRKQDAVYLHEKKDGSPMLPVEEKIIEAIKALKLRDITREKIMINSITRSVMKKIT